MQSPSLTLIAAHSLNRVIGRNNQLPWHLPADWQYFKDRTAGKPVLMGRKTYESLPGPLTGRRMIVLSRQVRALPQCEVIQSLEQLPYAVTGEAEVMVIGGEQIYRLCLPTASKIYTTEVQAEFDGDTFFPELDPKLWCEVARTHRAADAKNPYAMDFVEWHRVGDFAFDAKGMNLQLIGR